jgi:hypothetical protein
LKLSLSKFGTLRKRNFGLALVTFVNLTPLRPTHRTEQRLRLSGFAPIVETAVSLPLSSGMNSAAARENVSERHNPVSG